MAGPVYDDDDDDDEEIAAEVRSFFEGQEEDVIATKRAAAILMLLKANFPHMKKYQIMEAGSEGFFPLYAVREVGLFRTKSVEGFTRGRMVDVETQLRRLFEATIGPMSDEVADLVVDKIAMSPITSKL